MIPDYNEVDFNEIDKFIIENIEEINLLDVIKLDKDNYQRIDLLIITRYGLRPGNKDFVNQILPLILSFNNLSDITEIQIGQIFRFPELESLFENIYVIEDEDDVNGIAPLFQTQIKNQKVKDKNKTRALPKLNIELQSVTYNPETGIIKY